MGDGEMAMGAVRQMTISLPEEQAEAVESLVASGRYGSAEEVVTAGLVALGAWDDEVETWLRDEVGPTYDAVMAGRETVFTSEEVFGELRAHHERRVAERRGP